MGENVNKHFFAEIDCFEFQTISVKELVDVSEVFKDCFSNETRLPHLHKHTAKPNMSQREHQHTNILRSIYLLVKTHFQVPSFKSIIIDRFCKNFPSG